MGTADVWYGVLRHGTGPPVKGATPLEHPVFRGLGPELVTLATEGATVETYRAGDLVVHEGRLSDRLRLVARGSVGVELTDRDGTRRAVGTVAAGELLCWSWVGPPFVSPFDGRARTTTEILSLDAANVRRALELCPSDGIRFLQRCLRAVGQRLEATRAGWLTGGGR